jgi:sugar/nucleoside kinase (ribokinase family)
MATILLIGSVAEDEVIFLRSPMCEGAHLNGIEQGKRLGGGAANTGAALAHAGHRAIAVSPVGNDATGRWLKGQLKANGLDLSQIMTIEGRSTRSLVMLDALGERTIVNLSRAKEPEPPNRILEVETDCLFVRSRAPGLAPLMQQMASRCLVVAHMPPCNTGSRPAQVLVASASDLTPPQLEDPFALGREVAGELLQWVVITQGEKGATAYGATERFQATPPAVEVVDTTGAGDAFAAGLLHALVSNCPMGEALEIACTWGAEATQWTSSLLPAEALRKLI